MNVAIYLRKSRADENNPNETLEKHKEILLDYANENALAVIDIYEEVVSGGMLYNRFEMLKLLDNIPKGLYDAVLCIDLDRLGRGSAADSERIFDVLKKYNIKIITLKKVYDLNNEYDEDYSEFEMFMARKELKFITRRMNRGRVKSINDGCFVSGAPFGYRNAVINRRHTLEIYEPEAKYVRMIFDMYVNQNQGLTAISRCLESLGVTSKKGTPLNRSTISRILKNHTYIGKIVWNKSKTVKGQKSQVKTDKSSWLYIDGLHKPIVSVEIFNRAQELIKRGRKPPLNHGELKNPLAGLVKCANCGKTMVTNTSAETTERYRLICRTLSCNKSSALSIVENKIFEDIEKELSQLEIAVQQNHDKDISGKKAVRQELINNITRELKRLDTQESRLYDLFEQGIYDDNLFSKRSKSINERKNQLKAALSAARKKINAEANSDAEHEIPLFLDIIKNYNRLTPREKNTVLKNIIDHIEYRRSKTAHRDDIYLKIHYK